MQCPVVCVRFKSNADKNSVETSQNNETVVGHEQDGARIILQAQHHGLSSDHLSRVTWNLLAFLHTPLTGTARRTSTVPLQSRHCSCKAKFNCLPACVSGRGFPSIAWRFTTQFSYDGVLSSRFAVTGPRWAKHCWNLPLTFARVALQAVLHCSRSWLRAPLPRFSPVHQWMYVGVDVPWRCCRNFWENLTRIRFAQQS
jgi:hypothetical protein